VVAVKKMVEVNEQFREMFTKVRTCAQDICC
jgi:hypothetical protein